MPATAIDSVDTDVAIIGAGAAGLATAIFARRAAPHRRVTVLDGAHRPGAKILVSGGSRCNVTNRTVTDADFNGGSRAIVRRVLRAFPPEATVRFFEELGVDLHEERDGKLFPDSNRARDVLDALVGGLSRAGATLRPSHRVAAVRARADGTFELDSSAGPLTTRAVVLATGGLSLPKTGSDGGGYALAAGLGHSLVPTTPALVPLRFDDPAGNWHVALSGIAHPVQLTVRDGRGPDAAVSGALLWTHFGASGPAVLDASRHWLRARLEGRDASISASLVPGARFETMEADCLATARTNPRLLVQTLLAGYVPAAVGAAVALRAGVNGQLPLAELPRAGRRALLHALLDLPLPVVDSRGYNFAEVTAGGVPLQEIDAATMASRRTAGLFLVGEILDVDGRIGGFNFQWAWASAWVCAAGLARS